MDVKNGGLFGERPTGRGENNYFTIGQRPQVKTILCSACDKMLPRQYWWVPEPMHYRLRPIKEVQFGFAHFVSQIIRIQIFQIDFPLILLL